ncbi:hypothetical protein [Streptomyces sp. ICBB 8177]|uniref:WXG100 family type VII secretion target n=1 Tax=Streptomyces sp. ICBB 8177 TaxID=563922 RepID=UPI001F541BB0|nr:hypothetical protein [Streptomyces sp. ICBB 8177]
MDWDDLNPLHWIDKLNEQIGHSTADVLEFIGFTDPAVDPDGIRRIAGHWKALGDALDDAHWYVGQALGELRWEGKSADAFHTRAKDVRDHCQKASDALHHGHDQLNKFADQAHEMISQIGVLCAQILEFELAALPLSLLTGPLSEVASNLAAGERAAKIMALIARIAEAMRTVDRIVEGLLEALGGLGRALKALAPIAKMAAGGAAMTLGYDAIVNPGRLEHADSLEQDVEIGALLGIIGGGFGKGIQGLLEGLGPRLLPTLADAGLLGSLGEGEGALARLDALLRNGNEPVKMDIRKFDDGRPGMLMFRQGDRLRYRMNRIPPKDGAFDVGIHGDPYTVGYQVKPGAAHLPENWFHLTHGDMASLIKRNGWEPGQPVRLLSCSTGKLPDGFAQNLANTLGVPVEAPNNFLWVYPGGKMAVAPFADDGVNMHPTERGGFEVFTPGKD